MGAVLAKFAADHEAKVVADHLRGFPDADVFMHRLRPVILSSVLLLPGMGAIFYACSGTLARWLTRQWLMAFGICFGGILCLYLLIDFSTNVSRFADAVQSWAVFRFYAAMLPSISNVLLPFGTLLSVLLCMSRISRSRELVASLQTGKGMMRVLAPVYVSALLLCVFSIGLNFHWAPQSGGMKNALFDELRGEQAKIGSNIVYFHSRGWRMWKVEELPRDFLEGKPLRKVEVTSLNEDGTLAMRLYADCALWREKEGGWEFTGVKQTYHMKNEAPFFTNPPEPYVMATWTETPANLWKQSAQVRHLGLPDLASMMHEGNESAGEEWKQPEYMRYRAHWHFRFSQPTSCLVFAMLGIPLAMFVTRRQGSGSSAVAVVSAIVMMLFQSIFLALGESGYISEIAAAWLPPLFFGGMGLFFLRRRLLGKQLWPLW